METEGTFSRALKREDRFKKALLAAGKMAAACRRIVGGLDPLTGIQYQPVCPMLAETPIGIALIETVDNYDRLMIELHDIK